MKRRRKKRRGKRGKNGSAARIVVKISG